MRAASRASWLTAVLRARVDDLADLKSRGALVVWTSGDPNVIPVPLRMIAADAKVQPPFTLKDRRGDLTVQVGWAILQKQPSYAAVATVTALSTRRRGGTIQCYGRNQTKKLLGERTCRHFGATDARSVHWHFLHLFFAARPPRSNTRPSASPSSSAFAPGGIADTLARLIAHGIEGKLGQSVVVENRPGAGGNIAAGVVSRANPDGYTVLLTTTALAINLTLQKKNQFAADDLKAVAITASSPEALVANPSNPAKNLAEFVKAAKETKDKSINFGSAGVGSGSHIEAEYFFKKIANVNVVHIPYQGGAPAINALLGNQIDILATTLGGGAAAQIKGGKLKGLGIAADKRAAVDAGRADLRRAGLPAVPGGVLGRHLRAGQDRSGVVAKLNTAVQDVLNEPATQEKLTTHRLRPDPRLAGGSRRLFPRGNKEVGRDGERTRAIDQLIGPRTGGVHRRRPARRAVRCGGPCARPVRGRGSRPRQSCRARQPDRAAARTPARSPCESSEPVGSSARMTGGSLASARATATRWRWPPDSWSGRLCRWSASPSDASSSSARVAHGRGRQTPERPHRQHDVVERR